jgi:hypothetical protein
MEQNINEIEDLLHQYSLRRLEESEKLYRSLQQAAAALQEAQQLLQADRKFHEEMLETGQWEKLKTTEGPRLRQETVKPPWLLGRPPHLQ